MGLLSQWALDENQQFCIWVRPVRKPKVYETVNLGWPNLCV